MKKLMWCVVLVCGLAFASPGRCMAQMSHEGDDRDAIMDTLSQMDAAWDAHDMDAWVSYMTPDVEWVNVVGMWWRGKDEVLKAHKVMHAVSFKSIKMRTDDRTIEFVAPGVVLVTTTVWHPAFPTPGGHTMPEGQDRLTTLLVKQRDGMWKVRSGHNTPVDAAAAAHDPAKMTNRTPQQ